MANVRAISYDVVSMAAILRDYTEPEYLCEYHEKLCDVADTLYNIGPHMVEHLTPEYKEVYLSVDRNLWELVLYDMSALDGQCCNDFKVKELEKDYIDRCEKIRRGWN